MVEKTDMPSPDELRQLLRGELEAERAHHLYARLAENDEALDVAEGIWAEESPQVAHGPRPSAQHIENIELRIHRRLHRTHLAEDVTGFGSSAFLHVVLELLRATFGIFGSFGEASTSSQRRTS